MLTIDALKGLTITSAGIGLGLFFADLADRWWATRTPKDGKRPWYGRNAAAAIQAKPDAMRMGVQAGGAVAALAGAYWTRGNKILPWLLTGTAIGFGANLFMKLITWYIMPKILKVEDWSKESAGARYYPLEQESVQTSVTEKFEKWQQTINLNAQQQETLAGMESPLGSSNVYALGAPSPAPGLPQGVGQASPLLKTGRLGNCNSCGGFGGCYESCPDLCNTCPDRDGAKECTIVVASGDDIYDIATAAGEDVNTVNAMNGGLPETYWINGRTVRLPLSMCIELRRREGGTPSNGTPVLTRSDVPGLQNAVPAIPKQPIPTVRNQTYSVRQPPSPGPLAMMVAGPSSGPKTFNIGFDDD